QNCFEVDALGALRARLMEEDRAWERSGMGRLAAALERSVGENRQLLRRRARLGRLRAYLLRAAPALREQARAAAAAPETAAGTAAARERARERALGYADRAGADLAERFTNFRAALEVEVGAGLDLPRVKMPDVAETCRVRAAEFLAGAQNEW